MEEAKYDWRDKYAYDYELGVGPYDYETEDEYLRALDKANYADQEDNVVKLNVTLSECEPEYEYAWRDKYGRDDEFKIDPLDYETEDEYLTALNKAKYAWRDKCDYDSEFGISPYDYETEAEYNQALHDAKYSWRKSWAADVKKLNIDPNEYDTEKRTHRRDQSRTRTRISGASAGRYQEEGTPRKRAEKKICRPPRKLRRYNLYFLRRGFSRESRRISLSDQRRLA